MEADSFLPGIEAGMLSVRIDHLEPLLQVTMAASAPRYEFGHLICNYRTDGSEVVTVTRGMQIRTNAHWEHRELRVATQFVMGSFSKNLESMWSLSNDGRALLIRRPEQTKVLELRLK